MKNNICKKVTSMLSAYIENKLNENDRLFIENHFSKCEDCRKKFYEMSKIIGSLHFEYEKMLKEFDKIEENKIFNIKEYETFYENISPYIDDELCYEDCIKFRKYLLKSKPARDELSLVYALRNNIKQSMENFMDKSNINFAKKVVKKLKNEEMGIYPQIYKKAVVAIAFIISVFTILIIFMSFNYFHKSYAQSVHKKINNEIIFPDDTDWIEFYFDDENNLLFADK